MKVGLQAQMIVMAMPCTAECCIVNRVMQNSATFLLTMQCQWVKNSTAVTEEKQLWKEIRKVGFQAQMIAMHRSYAKQCKYPARYAVQG